jgi:hypothetical protein
MEEKPRSGVCVHAFPQRKTRTAGGRKCQAKQREMRDAITRLKRRSNSLSIKEKISDHALFQENPYQLS